MQVTDEFLKYNLLKKSYEQFKIYKNYADKLIKDNPSIDLSVFNEEDILFLQYNIVDESIFDIMRETKTVYDLDNRRVEELYMMLLIHDIMEKTTIAEAQLKGLNVLNNNKASHIETGRKVNSEPDLVFNNIYLEQQTTIKRYPRIYIKGSKLEHLRKKDETIYILEKYINPKDLTASYMLVNTEDSFSPVDYSMSYMSFKGVLRADTPQEYKEIDKALKPVIDALNGL